MAERKLKLDGQIVPLLTKIVEKAYFETQDAREKRLLASLLGKLN